jgi:hypothetical protein
MNTGRKFDEGKEKWSLLDYETIREMVQVLTVGAEKYGDINYQRVDPKRYQDALMRHIVAMIAGEENDPEDGKSHASHAMANLMFLRWHEKNGPKTAESVTQSAGPKGWDTATKLPKKEFTVSLLKGGKFIRYGFDDLKHVSMKEIMATYPFSCCGCAFSENHFCACPDDKLKRHCAENGSIFVKHKY